MFLECKNNGLFFIINDKESNVVAFWATTEVCVGEGGLGAAPFLWHGLRQRRHG